MYPLRKEGYFKLVFFLLMLWLIPFSLSFAAYTGLPSLDVTDGKFLAISGPRLQTFSNQPIIIWIGVPKGETSFELGIFDGDTGGKWDYILNGPNETIFTLYADPLKDGTGNQIVDRWYGRDMPDNNWFTKIIPTDSRALSPKGNYFYRLHINWEDTAIASALNAFKVRSSGQVSLVPGMEVESEGGKIIVGEVGFLGAPIGPNDPKLGSTGNKYNGKWDFYVKVPPGQGSLTFWDGDADHQDDQSNPGFYGSPPDDNPYQTEWRITPDIYYTITNPLGNVYTNNDSSGNTEWEESTISAPSNNFLPAGFYHWQWRGMDAHNLNFVRAPFEIYPTPDPPIEEDKPGVMLVPNRSVLATPGQVVAFNHTLTNTGDVPDSYDLSFGNDQGWGPITLIGDNPTPTLNPGQSINYQVEVQVPYTAQDGDTSKTTLIAISQNYSGVQAAVADTILVYAPPDIIIPEPRTIGYWKHEVEVYLTGRGQAHESREKMEGYLSFIAGSSQVFTGISDFNQVKTILETQGKNMVDKAKQQLMALWLNLASYKLGFNTSIDLGNLSSADTVGEAILEVESCILNFADLERAKDIAESLNLGKGIIP